MSSTTPQKNPVTSSMSKKRLSEIREGLVQIYGEDKIDSALTMICEVMKFDPENYRKGFYTPEKGQKSLDYKRKKATELGKSIYEVFQKKSAS